MDRNPAAEKREGGEQGKSLEKINNQLVEGILNAIFSYEPSITQQNAWDEINKVIDSVFTENQEQLSKEGIQNATEYKKLIWEIAVAAAQAAGKKSHTNRIVLDILESNESTEAITSLLASKELKERVGQIDSVFVSDKQSIIDGVNDTLSSFMSKYSDSEIARQKTQTLQNYFSSKLGEISLESTEPGFFDKLKSRFSLKKVSKTDIERYDGDAERHIKIAKAVDELNSKRESISKRLEQLEIDKEVSTMTKKLLTTLVAAASGNKLNIQAVLSELTQSIGFVYEAAKAAAQFSTAKGSKISKYLTQFQLKHLYKKELQHTTIVKHFQTLRSFDEILTGTLNALTEKDIESAEDITPHTEIEVFDIQNVKLLVEDKIEQLETLLTGSEKDAVRARFNSPEFRGFLSNLTAKFNQLTNDKNNEISKLESEAKEVKMANKHLDHIVRGNDLNVLESLYGREIKQLKEYIELLNGLAGKNRKKHINLIKQRYFNLLTRVKELAKNVGKPGLTTALDKLIIPQNFDRSVFENLRTEINSSKQLEEQATTELEKFISEMQENTIDISDRSERFLKFAVDKMKKLGVTEPEAEEQGSDEKLIADKKPVPEDKSLDNSENERLKEKIAELEKINKEQIDNFERANQRQKAEFSKQIEDLEAKHLKEMESMREEMRDEIRKRVKEALEAGDAKQTTTKRKAGMQTPIQQPEKAPSSTRHENPRVGKIQQKSSTPEDKKHKTSIELAKKSLDIITVNLDEVELEKINKWLRRIEKKDPDLSNVIYRNLDFYTQNIHLLFEGGAGIKGITSIPSEKLISFYNAREVQQFLEKTVANEATMKRVRSFIQKFDKNRAIAIEVCTDLRSLLFEDSELLAAFTTDFQSNNSFWQKYEKELATKKIFKQKLRKLINDAKLGFSEKAVGHALNELLSVVKLDHTNGIRLFLIFRQLEQSNPLTLKKIVNSLIEKSYLLRFLYKADIHPSAPLGKDGNPLELIPLGLPTGIDQIWRLLVLLRSDSELSKIDERFKRIKKLTRDELIDFIEKEKSVLNALKY